MKELFIEIYKFIRLCNFKHKWRKNNMHNFTNATCIFDTCKVSVGNGTYGNLYIRTFGNSKEYVRIGNYCSIADGVKFLSGGNHPLNCLSTFPFLAYYDSPGEPADTKGPIIIEDDVWIGTNAIILSGVRVGKGAVIAAGSVVSKDVPAYSIVGGVPARTIRKRFEESTIDLLVNHVDYSKITKDYIKDNIDSLVKPLSEELIYKIDKDLNSEE